MIYRVNIELTDAQIRKIEELTDGEYTKESPSGLYDLFLLDDDIQESIVAILEDL